MAKSTRTKGNRKEFYKNNTIVPSQLKIEDGVANPPAVTKDNPAEKKTVQEPEKPTEPKQQPNNNSNNDSKPTISDLFYKYMTFYTSKILPAYLKKYKISSEEFVEKTLNLVRNNDKLKACLIDNPASLFASILFGAEYGLIATEGIQHFFIIPYKVEQPDGRKVMTAKPQIGYQGCVHILTRSGKVKSIQAECVYKGDTFEYELGLDRKLKHIPNLNGNRKSTEIEYVYAVAKMEDGEKEFTVMTKNQVIAVQNLAKVVNNLYFNDVKDPNHWMARKAPIKQLAKLLPKDMDVQKAFDFDSKIEGGGTLILDENQNMHLVEDGSKIIEGSKVVPKRMTDIYGVWK
jgi:recombination protein RecT